MPFTPLHMGPALALKAVIRRRFSLTVFGVSQIVIDIEPLVHMIRGDNIFHGPAHTLIGAAVVALVIALPARYVCRALLRVWNAGLREAKLDWLTESPDIGRGVALTSALIGALSHVVLDGMVHPDVHPLAPFSDANPLLYVYSRPEVYLFCMITGVAGALGWIAYRVAARLRKLNQPSLR